MKERQKLWFIGLGLVGIAGFTAFQLKRINNFIDQFSFQPTVTSIKIENAKLWNVPPILGNARISVDIAVANPLNSSHAITDFSIRIFDTTNNSNTQIGYSTPIAQKIVIPAASTTAIKNVQLLIPVSSLISQVNYQQVLQMIQTQQFKLNRTYNIAVHLRLDGIAGNTNSKITI